MAHGGRSTLAAAVLLVTNGEFCVTVGAVTRAQSVKGAGCYVNETCHPADLGFREALFAVYRLCIRLSLSGQLSLAVLLAIVRPSLGERKL